jgi:hypothetical protein
MVVPVGSEKIFRPRGSNGSMTGSATFRSWSSATHDQRRRSATSSVRSRVEVPVYAGIAEKTKHLRELGMSDKAIGRALGVSDKTVAKSLMLPARADN